MLTRTLALLILAIMIAAPAAAQDLEVCYGSSAPTSTFSARLRSFLVQLKPGTRLAEPGSSSMSPVPQLIPPTTAPMPPIEELIELTEKCLGEMSCGHPHLHPAYRDGFAKLKCHCITGRCRPSKFQHVEVSATNETGLQVWANGRWCDVPSAALRRDRRAIPNILLQFRGHVCVSDTGCAALECAIVTETNG